MSTRKNRSWKSLKSFFSRKKNAVRRQKRQKFFKPRSEQLEDRRVLASVGDIAVIGVDTTSGVDGEDNFSFVVLNDIAATEEIIFTDAGAAAGGGFSATTGAEGGIKWTVPAGGASAGTVIRVTSSSGSFSTGGLPGGLSISVQGANVSEFSAANENEHSTTVLPTGASGMNLSNAGDQILIYQGTAASPTFLHGINTLRSQQLDQERRRAELAWATATRSDLEAARDHAARALADELRRWR